MEHENPHAEETPQPSPPDMSEEERIVASLREAREKLIREIPVRAARVERFGRWWALGGGCTILLGAILFAVGVILDDVEEPSFWVFFFAFVLTAVVSIISRFLNSRVRGLLLFIVPGISFAVMSGIAGYDFASFFFWGPTPPLSTVLPTVALFVVCALVGYAIIMPFIFGPLAALVARRRFPVSRFVARFGLITAVFWGISFIGYCYGIVSIFYNIFTYYTRYGVTPDWREAETLYLIFFLLSALPAFAIALVAALNGTTTPPERAKTLARRGIISALVCLGMLYVSGVIAAIIENTRYIYRYNPWDWDEFIAQNGLILACAGFVIIIATGLSHIIMQLAHRYWKRRVLMEIRRLEIEIIPQEPVRTA